MNGIKMEFLAGTKLRSNFGSPRKQSFRDAQNPAYFGGARTEGSVPAGNSISVHAEKVSLFRAKAEGLAQLQARIWFLHDEKNFEEMSKIAAKLFSALGFPKKKSVVAGNCVSNAYFYYDKAGEEDKKRNVIKREYYFKKVLNEQVRIRKLLGEDARAAYYENKWWVQFHYRNYLVQFPYMLRQQFVKYGAGNPLIPIRALYYLVKAGLKGHNKRRMDVAAGYLEKYWEISLKHMKDKVQY